MKFSVYQMEIIPGEPNRNRKKVEKWIEKVVKEERPDSIVLPEMWTTSYKLTHLDELADVAGEPTKSFLRDMAIRHNVNIIGGSVANKVDDQIFNTSFVFNASGELVYEYSKIHLVPMLDEPKYLTGGTKKVETFELDGIKMGIIICYDLRFPELARSLALEGAQVLFVVAEWPSARRKHWTSLQIARAIENQMYVVSSNSIGTFDGVEYAGSSMLIDPWGDVIEQGSTNQEETLSCSLDLEKVKQVREEVPIFSSRVPNLYN